MDKLALVMIPMFYIGLMVTVICGVFGFLQRSAKYLLLSTVLGLLESAVSMWSIGRFLLVLPIVTGIAGIVIWMKQRHVRKHTV